MKVILTLSLVSILGSFFGVSAQILSNDPNDVHFYLFPDASNVNSSDEILYDDVTSLTNSRYNPSLKTVFVTHGFRSNVSSDMPQTVKNAFLTANLGYNVIVVSWGALSTPAPPLTAELYSLVTLNVPIVAQRVSDFIRFLLAQNVLQLQSLYLVGHSLGAHVSGITGRNIFQVTGTKVPRVTGFDPAGPLYQLPLPSWKLVKTDADFVDVIHTNMGVLGDTSADGHADFFPNGGKSQPNCAAGDTESFDTLGRCSHWFSYRLYAASFTKDFPSCSCPNFFWIWPLNYCSSTCSSSVNLGYYCPTTANGLFYLTTSNPP